MKRNVKQNNRSVGAVYEQAAGYYLEQNGYERSSIITDAVTARLILLQKTETVMCFAK